MSDGVLFAIYIVEIVGMIAAWCILIACLVLVTEWQDMKDGDPTSIFWRYRPRR